MKTSNELRFYAQLQQEASNDNRIANYVNSLRGLNSGNLIFEKKSGNYDNLLKADILKASIDDLMDERIRGLLVPYILFE